MKNGGKPGMVRRGCVGVQSLRVLASPRTNKHQTNILGDYISKTKKYNSFLHKFLLCKGEGVANLLLRIKVR